MSSTPIIIESLFLIVSMVAFSAFTAVYLSNSSLISDFQRSSLSALRDRYQTDVRIVFAFYDADHGSLRIFVKNVGNKDISKGELRLIDLYLISSQRVERYSYSDDGAPGSWVYRLINDFDMDGKWSRGETVEITVVPLSALTAGDYVVRIVLHNGLSFDGYFSL
ncbi:MAG: hypothetical protein QXZ17_04955 [Nitrososphaerota archaeon]